MHTVSAYDQDTQLNYPVEYDLEGVALEDDTALETNLFSINATSGKVITNHSLNYEIVTKYIITVKVCLTVCIVCLSVCAHLCVFVCLSVPGVYVRMCAFACMFMCVCVCSHARMYLSFPPLHRPLRSPPIGVVPLLSLS